jgi:AraC family transcriptional regulator, melibiose operon regulatory protein
VSFASVGSGSEQAEGMVDVFHCGVGLCARSAADLARDQPERHRIAMLEVEARVRRLALANLGEPVRQYTGGDPALRRVVAMMRHIAEHFHEPLTVADIAGAAQLHPNYAMAQFRKVVRTTMGDYLTQCRLAEARRLLVTTDLPINDVASEAGFGSVSRFYTAFTSGCGTPPAKFRREHRGLGLGHPPHAGLP